MNDMVNGVHQQLPSYFGYTEIVSTVVFLVQEEVYLIRSGSWCWQNQARFYRYR